MKFTKKNFLQGTELSGSRAERIPLQRPFRTAQDRSYIDEVLASGRLTGDGAFSRNCETWLEANLRCGKAMLTPSCTAALEMAALLLDVSPGDEIIMPSYTFVSTANAFVLRGAVPVFVDIRADTLNLDEMLIEAAITEKTRAIVPVHYAGQACNMDAIVAIAEKNDIAIIEDAAQALLSVYRGKFLGAIGRIGCVSFHATKNVTSGHGGAILLNDERDLERAEVIRDRGTNRHQFLSGGVQKYSWVDIGSSFFMSEICSAALFAQLQNAKWTNEARISICNRYRAGLASLEADGRIRLPTEFEEMTGNGHIFYLLANDLLERDLLLVHLRAKGIEAAFHYTPLHSSPAGRRFGRTHGSLPNTQLASDRIVRLPVFPSLRDDQLEQIISAVREFYWR